MLIAMPNPPQLCGIFTTEGKMGGLMTDKDASSEFASVKKVSESCAQCVLVLFLKFCFYF